MRPRIVSTLLTLASLMALLAGCAEEPAAALTAPEPEAPADEETAPSEQSSDFGWAAATGTPSSDVQLMASNAEVYDVADGAAMLVANVTWSCASPTCDLHAYLCAPGEADAGPLPLGPECAIHAMGGSPLSLVAEAPEAGEWMLYLASDGPSADVVGTITFAES